MIEQPTKTVELTGFEWGFLASVVDQWVNVYYSNPNSNQGMWLEQIQTLQTKLREGLFGK